MCKSHILLLLLLLLLSILLLLSLFYARAKAGQVKFQRSGPEISNRKLTENGDA